MKIFYWAIRCYYFLGLGKLKIFLSRKLGLAGRPVEGIAEINFRPILEKDESKLLKTLSPITAQLVNLQLKRFKVHQDHRAKVSKYYNQHLDKSKLLYSPNTIQPLLRYPIRVNPERRKELLSSLKKERVLAGEWYPTPILQFNSTEHILQYKRGSCPNVEKAVKEVVNLPTNYFVKNADLKRIVSTINKVL